MLRRYSPLVAAFLLSGLLTRAGFAGASTPASASAPQVRAEVSPELAALLESDPAPAPVFTAQMPEVDWSRLIDERLAQLSPTSRPSTHINHRLAERVDAALDGLDDARVAVEVRELDSGAVLVAHDPERALNPASNQKLITAIAAVELLGPDYHFETKLLREGDALILRGEGDPDLHVHDLRELVDAVASTPGVLDGVRRLVIDDGSFDARSLGPGFRRGGPGDSYQAPSGALALDYGTVTVTVTPGAHHRQAQIHVAPASAAIVLDAEVETGGVGELEVRTRAGEGGRTIVAVSGSIPGGHAPITVRRRVSDPGLVAGACFADMLAAATGVELPVSRGTSSDAAELLHTHRSATLVTVLGSALRYSNNFTAEQVLRTLAWRASGEPGSWKAGARVLERFAAAVSPAADDQRFVNGSGLSLEGRLSPRFVIDVLALTERPGSPAQTLLASFATPGQEGTLRRRLSWAGDRVAAKTGTYAGASTLSGIVRGDDGRALGFSILVNGAGLELSRAAQDRVVAALLSAK